MEKAHSRIKWENYPSIATPLNETNLNKMDVALDEVDNRVLGLDTAKLDKATANTMVKDISFAENTGIFTITLLNGTKKTIDTKLEKIATNFNYDYQTQKLNLTLVDGTIQELDLTSLISQVEFMDSDTIDISVDSTGKVSAIVKDGSITEAKLQPNYLAEVKVEVAKAKSSSDSSYENAETARESATEARQFRDEAEQFRNQAEAMSGINIATTEIAGIVKPDGTTIRVDPDGTIHADRGTTSYADLENKPKINGVEIAGELTTEDLNIDLGTVDYEELENKPSINNIELSGNKTLQELGIQPQGDYPARDSLKPYVFSNPTNNLLATEPGTPLDAVQGKVLNDRCTAISEELSISTNVLPGTLKTDMLDVDLANSTADKNKVHRIGTADASKLINSPITSGNFYGKWECIFYGVGSGGSRLMVKITEFHPVQGRIWYNHYNWTAWAGWFSEYDRLSGHLNTISKSKIAFGEMGAYENLEVRGSICCQFNVYNKCDVHISCKVISNTVGGTTNFGFLSGAKIRELLGINSLSVNAFSTKTIVQNFSGTNFGSLAGNGGFRALTTPDGNVQIGRIYTTDGQIGSWGMHSDLFKPETIFEIDLYNCSYT